MDREGVLIGSMGLSTHLQWVQRRIRGGGRGLEGLEERVSVGVNGCLRGHRKLRKGVLITQPKTNNLT